MPLPVLSPHFPVLLSFRLEHHNLFALFTAGKTLVLLRVFRCFEPFVYS